MSITTLRIALRELAVVRIHCAKCADTGTILEIPVASLLAKHQYQCPVCGTYFFNDPHADNSNYLRTLAIAFDGLLKSSKQVEIEFVLPAGDA